MKKLPQTRFGDEGNCYSACIASLMDKDSAEDVFQVMEHYNKTKDDTWIRELSWWLFEEGWIRYQFYGHQDAKKDEFYLVSGKSPRYPTERHMCIYQNGKLFHDPYTGVDGTGILTEDYFEIIEKI